FGPLFQYLDSLETTVERVAAGQVTREAIAVVKKRQFIEFCERAGGGAPAGARGAVGVVTHRQFIECWERAGDRATATLYQDVIEPDERFHHELGRSILLRLATTPEAQAAGRRPAARTPG